MSDKGLENFNILGVNISAIDMADACFAIEDMIAGNKKGYVCVCPVSTIMECRKDKNALNSVNSAVLATPDGMPVVWMGKLKGYSNVKRVYGPDLMLGICRISEEKGYRNYFYGSTAYVLDKLKEKLKNIFPGLRICGMYSPPFRQLSKDEDDKVADDINRSNPDIVWVGLGSPKQDLWMHEHRDRINGPVMIGVGAAFDFLAGTKKQAPRWMQKIGMEWFFRLITEPKRLWKRYVFGNVRFLYLVTQELLTNAADIYLWFNIYWCFVTLIYLLWRARLFLIRSF